MAHDFSVFDRPDLNVRMTSRRRLPKPSASATPSTLNGIGQHPQPILTYSQFLGMFDDESTPMMNGNGVHPLSPITENGYPFNHFDPLGAGPSRAHSSTYQGFQSPASVVESGWIKDVFGKDQWVGHGKIEEVDDAAAVSVNLGDDDVDNLATPRAQSAARLSWHSSNNHPNGHEQDAIPLNSTPPPCPRPRKLPSLRETPTGSDYPSFKATSANTPAMAPPTYAGTSSTALDDPTEVALVKQNLELLASCTEDIKVMETYFLVQPIELELSQHIDICSRLQESLRSLRDTLTHRAKMGAEEWHVRSSSWHQKYSKRLLSLQTTLQRLSRMREPIENQPLRPRQRLAVLTKLEQHEAKLADLASKYTVAFDRLRLRHLHFLLTQSHIKAKQQKAQKTRLMSRASFEREWKEGKTIRASLRHAFHDLRQEFYNNSPRSGRHTSAP